MNLSQHTGKPPIGAKGKPATPRAQPWVGPDGKAIAGWFTEPCRRWKRLKFDSRPWAVASISPRSNTSGIDMTAERERRAREGIGWGAGTLAMPNTRHMQKMPGMMPPRRVPRMVDGELRPFKCGSISLFIRAALREPDGLAAEELAKVMGLSLEDAGKRIASFRHNERNAGRPDVQVSRRNGVRGAVRYFATGEALAKWEARQLLQRARGSRA